MYLRNIRLSEMVEWLIANNFDQLQAADLAQRLIDKFDVLTYSREAV